MHRHGDVEAVERVMRVTGIVLPAEVAVVQHPSEEPLNLNFRVRFDDCDGLFLPNLADVSRVASREVAVLVRMLD